MIDIADWQKLDVRIGTILRAELVPETDKLVKFEIDLGSEKRQIIGGFAPSYPDPKILIGKQVPVLCNLEPRTLRGLESNGMILAASTGEGGPAALHPDQLVDNGTTVR